jgi:hypothetical protein
MHGRIAQTLLLRKNTIPLAARYTGIHLYKNSLGKNPRSIIWSRNFALQLSSVSGSSFLSFRDPWDRCSSTSRSIDNNNSQSMSSSGWIAISPTSSLSVTQRIIRWLRQCWKRICRFSFVTMRTSEVILRIFPLTFLFPTAVFSTRVFGSDMISNVAWNYAIMSIQQLGPVAIKLFQWAATRRDLFPPSICDRLSILHDKGYPHSLQWTRRVLTESFGDYERKGLEICNEIGCGSAAQVYRGKLTVKSTTNNNSEYTRDVAIKVLHPRFQELVDRDLDFIEIIADFLNYLPFDQLKMLNLPRAVEEFSVVIRDQADLRIEAENLRQFRRNFYKNSQQTEDRSSIVFPQPIDGWVSSDVLVEDYAHDSVPIANFLLDSSQEGMSIRRELAGPLLRAFFKMVFLDNFIHGDLHPVCSPRSGSNCWYFLPIFYMINSLEYPYSSFVFCTMFLSIIKIIRAMF